MHENVLRKIIIDETQMNGNQRKQPLSNVLEKLAKSLKSTIKGVRILGKMKTLLKMNPIKKFSLKILLKSVNFSVFVVLKFRNSFFQRTLVSDCFPTNVN